MIHTRFSTWNSLRFLMAVIMAFGMAGQSTPRAAADGPVTTATRVYGQGGIFTTNDPNKDGSSASSLFLPTGVALDGSGGLYVADASNNRVLYFPAGSLTATRVYGQNGSFVSNAPNKNGITADSLYFTLASNQYSIGSLALDKDGGLYVSDAGNNRVLYYPSGSTTATRVYGQSGSFTSNGTNEGAGGLWDLTFCYNNQTLGANSLNHPGGLVVDKDGNLYVADTYNSRVLFYPSGSTTATRLYGHSGDFSACFPNLVAEGAGPNADSLYAPSELALDYSGGLYVADTSNNRVLYYPANSTTATAVYGQGGSFTSNTSNNGGLSASSLYSPSGLVLDGSGDLFVSDTANNRVLYYPSGSTTATAVYGQGGSFSSNTADNGGINTNSLAYPSGLAIGSSGNLFVADTMNNRVLAYPPTSSGGAGTPAMQVTGNNQTIPNGDPTPSLSDGTNFGSVWIPFGTLSHTFAILNTGTADLNLTDYALVTISGPDAGDFTVTSPPSTPVTYGGGWTTFTIQFSPSATGTRSATVNIGDDDSANDPFTFAIQGTGFLASGTTAVRVYGQGGDFTTNDPQKGGSSADSLYLPTGVALDGGGDLYVLDDANNRVLYYPSGSTTATRVYGQNGSFVSNAPNKNGISADSLYFALSSNQFSFGSLALDKDGDLYVADAGNNRVLFYPSGSTTATRVYGQGGSFITGDTHEGSFINLPYCYSDATLGANSLNHPSGLALDKDGNLYVADTGNNRVLFYPSGSITATAVYGQDGFFTYCLPNLAVSGPNADSLYEPTGLALDGSGNLYLADSGDNRVLYYPSGSTTATVVYGQDGSFTSTSANNGGLSADSLNSPSGLALDGSGGLYVSDTASNRVLYYPSGQTTATRVYGQGGSFSSNTANNGGISADSLQGPFGLALTGSGSLYVADTLNNRVLAYPPTNLATPGTPSMQVTGRSHPINNGDLTTSITNDTDFGIATTPFGVVSHTFAIFNTGTGDLNLTGYPRVAIHGPDAGDFTLKDAPPSSPVAPGGAWTLFTIQFAPSATGLRSATISITSDDGANDPYTFAIQGTGAAAPTVTTGAAGAITYDGATLHGTVNANYADATVTFRYGLTAALGTIVPADESPVSGSTDKPVSATLSGLQPATLYHYRVYATNSGGTARGDDQTFTTGCYSSLTVTSNLDDVTGSLRQAIAQACSGTTIDFDTSLSASTILLASPLTLDKNLTIDGSGLASQVTISGNSQVVVFYIPQGVTATLEGLKIVNGHNDAAGGGILNLGTLTVDHSTLSGNTSGTFGAGIISGGPLTVLNSTLTGNQAGVYGGGIYEENYALTVVNSTLAGNSASAAGGGIYLRTGSLTLLTSTLSGNSAGGGLVISSGTLNYANTIIANSTGGDCSLGGGTLGTNKNNLVQDGSCSAAKSGDPKLGALADNGGPTRTMALQSGSPAINAGDYPTCTGSPVNGLDQRGADRTNTSHKCDIGAYELQPPDTTPPVVYTFTAPSISHSLDIPITSFTAHDDTGVTGYLITDSITKPLATDPGWTTSAPTSFHVNATGPYSLFPWAKDAASNISPVSPLLADVTVCFPAVTVENNNDSGPGSLRQAIIDLCAGGTITFNGDFNGANAITLASALPNLDRDMTIDGSGHAVTVDGGGSYRIFHVFTGASVTLKTLTLKNGNASAGGAVFNEGILTVLDSTFSGNTATVGGALVSKWTTATITGSVFSDNQATSDGGGIYNYAGTLTLANSTFSGNTASDSGGGIYNGGSTLTVTNSTLAGNSAGTSGGGIATQFTGTVTLQNILLADNPGGNCAGTITDGGHNLGWGDSTCPSTFLNTDPKLGMLADNGGPTQTMALLPGSAAIDAGVAVPIVTADQRGVSRPQGSGVDIGAFEVRTCTVTTNADGTSPVPAGSLREKILDRTCSVINFDADYIIILTSALPNLDRDVVLDGSGHTVTIDGGGGGGGGGARIFNITSDGNVTLENLTLQNGRADNGGGVYNAGTLTVTNVTFTGNQASNMGGGIYSDELSSLTISNSIFSANSASYTSGAILVQELASVQVTNTTFSGNSATATSGSFGGAISNIGTMTITGSTLVGNTAYNEGGAIMNNNNLTVTNSTLQGNSVVTSQGEGGGIYNNYLGTLSLLNSTLSGNSAQNQGGGLYNLSSNHLSLVNNIIAGSPSGGDCHNAGTIETNTDNLVQDGSCSAALSGDPLLAPLGDYGGPAQTMALLPGSPAIDAGDPGSAPAGDQRGISRPQGAGVDIGAFESRGFSLAKIGGDNQSAPIYSLFTNPLALSITANNTSEPVNGGVVTFSGPASGAGTHPTVSMTVISGGVVSQNITANSLAGSYAVTASTSGASSMGFNLTNTTLTPCSNPITVTSDADSGTGSLRQAIVALCQGGTITFDSDHTIKLTSALPDLDKDMTIDGRGHTVTVDGNASVRPFTITNSARVTLNALIITNCNTSGGGGSIYNDHGFLTISNSVVSNNNADSGGGIYNNGTLSLSNSTISDNSALNGGAIYGYAGTMTVANSTLSYNIAEINGGGIYSLGTLTVTNSTLSQNSVNYGDGGGIYQGHGSLTLLNSTLAGNDSVKGSGGLVLDAGSLSFANTIISDSTGGDCSNNGGSIIQNLNNLVQDGSCSTLNGNPAPGFKSGDPRLGSLKDNGGPTQTMALLPGSPAIDAGDPDTCAADPVDALDQRGFPRPAGARCDIGAFELDDTKPVVDSFTATSPTNTLNIPITAFTAHDDAGVTGYLITTSTSKPDASNPGWTGTTPTSYAVGATGSYSLYPWAKDASGNVSDVFASPAQVQVCYPDIIVQNANDSGAGSLRQAILDLCPGGTISFDGDLSILLLGTLTISQNMTITGAPHQVTVDGNGKGSVFNVSSGEVVTLDALIVTGGSTDTNGGGIVNLGNLTVQNSTVSGNHANSSGGGIFNGGVLTISNSTISANQTSEYGGGIFNNKTLTVSNSTIRANTADMEGGGICNYDTLTVTGSTLTGNQGGNGGGIYNRDSPGTANVTDSTLQGNIAGPQKDGHDIYNAGTLYLVSSTLAGEAGISGGSELVNHGHLYFGNTIIAHSPGVTACSSSVAIASNSYNLVQDGTCSTSNGHSAEGFKSGDPLLAPLADYGGRTQTMALLPGSPAIDAGNYSGCIYSQAGGLDQRGVDRTSDTFLCDIGAFETQGFTFTNPSGDDQSATVNTAFTNPLGLTVSPVRIGDPVDGGLVTFTGPSSDASTDPAVNTAVISSGVVSLKVTANGTPGSYTVTASASGVLGTTPFSLTNLATSTTTVVTFEASPYVYRGTAFTATAHVTGAGGLDQDVTPVTFGGDCTNVTSANGCWATATFPGDATHTASSDTEYITITQAPSTTIVTWEAGPYTYRGTAFTATAHVSGVGGLDQDVTPVTYGGDCTNVTKTDGCSASAKYTGDTNHASSGDIEYLTITKASSTTTVTFELGSYTYRGTAFSATALVTGAGGLDQNVTPVIYGGDCKNVSVANGCTASASFLGDADHTGSRDSKSITILPATLTVKPDNLPIAFGSPVPGATFYTFSVTGFVNGENASTALAYSAPTCGSAYTSTTPSSPPTLLISCGGNPNGTAGSATDYTFNYTATAALTVGKSSSTTSITWEPAPYTYRGTAFKATATVTGTGGLNQAVPVTYTGNCKNVTVPNGCTASASFPGDANHTPSSDSKSITITQALLTVSPSPINPSVQYSDASPAISPSITGFVNGETASVLTKQPTCTTTRKVTDPAGSYPITCSGGQATNYSFLYVAGSLTITQEDAYLQYSGDSLAQINTNLNLRVTVWDSAAVGYPSTSLNPESKPKATIGDITKMWIQFNIFPENTCGTSTTIAPLYAQVSDAPTIGDGIGTASATYKSTTEASYCVIARLVASKTGGVNQYYTAPDTESAAISFYQNSGRFASGDGWITDPNGQPGSFGFFSRFDSKGNPFGQLVYVYRGTYNGIPAVFIIRSNSLTALQISGTIYPLTATLQGKCTIQVIRAFGGAALYSDTAATFKAVAVDTNKNPATKSDSFALTVWDKKGVVYKTVLTSLLSQGDIVIHLK